MFCDIIVSMRVPKRRSEQFIKKKDTSAYLTPEAVLALQKELRNLHRSLPPIIAEAMRTKEYGDLSENAEYQDAKRRLRGTHARIAHIKDQLTFAEIIPKATNASGIVAIGSTVVVELNGTRVTYTILGSHESKPGEGTISDRSPLGRALLGRSAGEMVRIETPRGAKEYRIVSVRG